MTNSAQAVPAINPSELSVVDGQVTTTSLYVAEHFGKRHDDVLKRIRSLDCSPEFRARNFAESEQVIKNGNIRKAMPYYRMTRDGFSFLCFGFTGKEAARWKEAYINAFNQMEAKLREAANDALTSPIQQHELTLDYEGRRLRIVHLDGAPWLVAADLALALGLRNSYVILRRLPNEQQRKILFGNQQINIINLDGVRRTMLAAAAERARAFGKWLEQALELQQTPAVPTPQVDPGSLLRGMLAGNRFMCLLDSAGRITLREIPEDHMTIAMDQVPNWVADPCGARPELLPRILQAVSQRMGAKV